MIIYSSTKVLPYVYQLTHKETGQFYIGVRFANKVPSSEDLGTHYFSSSNPVKELGFENFNSFIIAEFFDRISAINFEKDLITEHWNNFLNLNKNIGGANFCDGPKSKETKIKMKAPKSEIHKLAISRALSGVPLSKERKQKISHARLNSDYETTDKHRLSLSLGLKRFYENGGTNSMKGNKQSQKAKDEISKNLKIFYSLNEHYEVTEEQKHQISETLKERYKNGTLISPRLGTLHTAEAKEKNRQKALARPKIQCPYCLKVGPKPNMLQWHFTKCKFYRADLPCLNGTPNAGQ